MAERSGWPRPGPGARGSRSPRPRRNPAMARGKASLLLVDAEPAMRLLVTSILRDEGHDVTAAANGEEALQLIERRHYHLIISDLKMPGMSGVDLLERIKKDDPGTAG